MFTKSTPEVLVVGAGPVGMFAALNLAQRGVRVQIVDKSWKTGSHSYALTLHQDSLHLFAECGLSDSVRNISYPIRSIGLYDGCKRRATINLDNGGLAVTGQNELEAILESALDRLGVRVHWSHEADILGQDDRCVMATINQWEKDSKGYIVAHSEWVLARSMSIDVPYVIGADGHNSPARCALGFSFPEVAPPQDYAVFEFQTDFDTAHELRIVAGPTSTDVLWPLPEGVCRWSFELSGLALPESERAKDRLMGSKRGDLPILEDASLKAFIRERAPWFEGTVERVIWRDLVRFERRLASRFGAGRIWLAGDSAHITGPVGVQSMNVGLAEARHLATILAEHVSARDGAGAFDHYGKRWMTVWRQLFGLDESPAARLHTDPWIATIGPRLISCLPGYGRTLGALAGQLGLRIES